MYLTNRTAAETDDTCPRRFWLSQKAGGKGVVPKEDALALRVGKDVHADMALVAEMEIQDFLDQMVSREQRALTEEMSQIERELLWRQLGWSIAWATYLEPKIRQNWSNVAVEHELILDRDPLWVAVTPDRVLRHNTHGFLRYLEYKSTISSSMKWLNSWPYMVQIHSSLKAVEEEMEEPVKYAQVVGLMKGYQNPQDQRMMHPYVWAYRNANTGAWTHEWEKARAAVWSPAPVWEYEGGLLEWVQQCGVEVAEKQFPHTPPIYLNERILDAWIARRTSRERVIELVEEKCHHDPFLLAINFPQYTKQCRPPFGDACPYLRVCWNASVDPTNDPDFVPRIPHHDVELIGIE
jgi:hypothetical protein